MTTDTEKRLAEIRERSAELNGMYRSQADSNVDFLLAKIERLTKDRLEFAQTGVELDRNLGQAIELIETLTAERDAAWVALSWAMDEIDVLSINATAGWAYPQGMGYLRRDEQADSYFAACKVRALSPSTLNKSE